MDAPYFQKYPSNVHNSFDRNYKHFDVILFSALNSLIPKVIVKIFYYISETNEIHTYIYQNIRNILTSTQPTSYCSVIFRKLCNWCLIFQMKIYFSPDGYQSQLQCQNTYNKYIILLRNRITIRICVHLNQIG